MRRNKFCTLLLCLVCCCVSTAEEQKPNRENVIAQMNYCTNSLTNIINNKSMAVLDHESNQLLNNLTMEQACGIYEIRDYRQDLLEAIGKFQITEEERQIVRRVQSIKRDNLRWQALSNALSPTMLLTGGGGLGYQAAYQALVTAARSCVEYKTAQGEQKIEELQALWELRKSDMENILRARLEAQNIVFQLYGTYGLKEYDRLTEQTATNFVTFVSETDASKRIRVLIDNKRFYANYAPYYYYLGMAYVDNGDFYHAKQAFGKYKELYAKAPIFRYDEMSGCIALAELSLDKSLSAAEKIHLIKVALNNLPNNSAAALQCAMVYIHELHQEEKGLDIIRAAIDDPNASDKELLYMSAANLLPLIRKYPAIHRNIVQNFESDQTINFESYLTYVVNSTGNAWPQINDIIQFDKTKSPWYRHFFHTLNEDFEIILPIRFLVDEGDLMVYVEFYEKSELSIEEKCPRYENVVTQKSIDKIECFQANKALKYLYMDELVQGKYYRIKKNIDYKQIQNENWPRQSEFTLSESDIKDIVKFCKKNKTEDNVNILSLSESSFYDIALDAVATRYLIPAKIRFLKEAYSSIYQEGIYVRIAFSSGLQIVYKLGDDYTLENYYYQIGNKRVFANKAAYKEFKGIQNSTSEKVAEAAEQVEEESQPVEEVEDDKPGFWSRVKGWFSKDEEAEEQSSEEVAGSEEPVEKENQPVDEVEEDKPSFWSRVKGWFSKDEEAEEQSAEEVAGSEEPVEEENQPVDEVEEDKPGFWSRVKGWFSKDDESEEQPSEEVAEAAVQVETESQSVEEIEEDKPGLWSRIKGWFSKDSIGNN